MHRRDPVRRSCGVKSIYPLLVMLVLAPAAQAMDARLMFTLGHDDNLGNVSGYATRYPSATAEFGLTLVTPLGQAQQFGHLFGAGLQARRLEAQPGLSSLDAELNWQAWLAFGRGFYAPAAWLLVAAGYQEYDSEGRDASWSRARLSLNQRWTSRIMAQGFLQFSATDARESVFDSSAQEWGLALYWQVAARLSLRSAYSRRNGDISVSARASEGTYPRDGSAIRDDGFSGDLYAFRLPAHSHVISAGAQWQINRDWSADLDWRMRRTPAQSAYLATSARSDYRRQQVLLGLSYGF